MKPVGDGCTATSPTTLLRWWDAYPTVKASLPFLTADEVASLVRNPSLKSGDKVAVVDVRRNDHDVRIQPASSKHSVFEQEVPIYRGDMCVEVNSGPLKHSTTTCLGSSQSTRTPKRSSSTAKARTVVDPVPPDGKLLFLARMLFSGFATGIKITLTLNQKGAMRRRRMYFKEALRGGKRSLLTIMSYWTMMCSPEDVRLTAMDFLSSLRGQ